MNRREIPAVFCMREAEVSATCGHRCYMTGILPEDRMKKVPERVPSRPMFL